MDTISLRKFREFVADLEEPVEVVKREPGGQLRVLGVWTPLSAATVDFRPTVTYNWAPTTTTSSTLTHWHPSDRGSDER